MLPCDGPAVCKPATAPPPTRLEKILRVLAVLTMVMTLPQVYSVWTEGGTGVSLASWSSYLVSSVAWLVYGLEKRDATIYLVCVGWIILDAAIIGGLLVRS